MPRPGRRWRFESADPLALRFAIEVIASARRAALARATNGTRKNRAQVFSGKEFFYLQSELLCLYFSLNSHAELQMAQLVEAEARGVNVELDCSPLKEKKMAKKKAKKAAKKKTAKKKAKKK